VSFVAVCTDASALVPASAVERFAITVVPIAVAVDGEPFADPDGRVDAFYDLLVGGATATTSQPSPGVLAEAYAAAAARGAAAVLSIHLDARASGTVRAAEAAAHDAPVPVRVVDSGTASYGVGLCARRAAEALEGGASLEVAAEEARALGSDLSTAFVARASPAGRVPETAGWAVLGLSDGVVAPLSPASTLEVAITAIARIVAADERPIRAAVGHASRSLETAAGSLASALEGLAQLRSVERYRVGAAVGAHTGPWSVGAFWWPVTPC